MKKSLVLSFVFALLPLLMAARSVSALTAPSFPSCLNPQGIVISQYDSGTHGIPGDSTAYQGSDVVYQLNGNNLQCFCSSSGAGIQTNWWKIGQASQEEIDNLKKLGWVYIPDGSVWGLQAAAYMAINASYSCTGNPPSNNTPSGGGSAPVCNAERPAAPVLLNVERKGSLAILTWSKVDKATHYTIAYGTAVGDYPYGVFDTGNVTTYTIGSLDPNTKYYFVVYAVNDCMPSVSSTQGGTGGQVLGLASTGTQLVISAFALLGTVSLGAGLLLKKTSKSY